MRDVMACPAILRLRTCPREFLQGGVITSPRLSRARPAPDRVRQRAPYPEQRSRLPALVRPEELFGLPKQKQPRSRPKDHISPDSRFVHFESANLDQEQAAGPWYKRAGKSSQKRERIQRAIQRHRPPVLSHSLPYPFPVHLYLRVFQNQ